VTKYCNGFTPPQDPAHQKNIPRYPANIPPLFSDTSFACIFCPVLNAGDFKMAKNIRGKRPCCICRKWFQPIAQQKGRQMACSPECSQEHHRRQCQKWNRKNKAYFKNNYLADKLQAIDEQEKSRSPPADQPARPSHSTAAFLLRSNRTEPALPMEVIAGRLDNKNAAIIHYLVFQVIRHIRFRTSGFP